LVDESGGGEGNGALGGERAGIATLRSNGRAARAANR
jgi:hypothetical protein